MPGNVKEDNGERLGKVLVLSLDGTPYNLLLERMKSRPASPWHQLLKQAPLHRIRSSRPEVSSVAWASYLTGTTPSHHGIFGFADRSFSPFRLYYPNGSHLRQPTLFERVHDAGGTVVSLNVPGTSPAKPLRGIVVGGFLIPSLDDNVQPQERITELRNMGYTVDSDPALAHQNRDAFLDSLISIQEARIAAGLQYAEEFDWNLFHLHLMEPDRLYHFYWGEPEYDVRFHQFLDRVDEAVSRFAEIAHKKNAALVLLSDHGFTRARRIFFINAFLKMAGLLSFNGPPSLENIHPQSRAYALPPGRIFLNLRGREPMGRVSSGKEAEALLQQLEGMFREIKDPQTGEKLIEDVLRPSQYDPGPLTHQASDLLLAGKEGVDMKADFLAEKVLSTPRVLVGTHTYKNAFFHVSNAELPKWKEDEGDVSAAGRHVAHLLHLPKSNSFKLL